MADTKLSLAQRIAKVMIDLGPVKKEGKVSFGNTKYNYVKAETLFALLQTKMAENGIVVIPGITGYAYSPDGKIVNVSTTYRIQNIDERADFFDVPWLGQAPANDDKGVNKAGTSSEKYMLMKLFLISDEEDPDAEVYDPNKQDRDRPAKPEPKQEHKRDTFAEDAGRLLKALDETNASDAYRAFVAKLDDPGLDQGALSQVAQGIKDAVASKEIGEAERQDLLARYSAASGRLKAAGARGAA